jgi:hypothetical protein
MEPTFYRDIHKQEFDRRETLASRSNAIIAGLTTLGGGIGFLVAGFKDHGAIVELLFWAPIGAAAVAVAVAAGFLIASYRAPPLMDIDAPSAWKKYLAELQAEHRVKPGAFASPDAEFEDTLTSSYIDCTEKNIAINTARGFRLVKSNFCDVGGVSAAGLGGDHLLLGKVDSTVAR